MTKGVRCNRCNIGGRHAKGTKRALKEWSDFCYGVESFPKKVFRGVIRRIRRVFGW